MPNLDDLMSPTPAPAGATVDALDDAPGAGPAQPHPRHEQVSEPQLLLQARGLEYRGRENQVFGPLDWDLRDDQVGVLAGKQGSGRSALLLALAGRLKGTRGSLQVGDLDGTAHPRALRQQVSVARITGLAELEPNLTVAESRDERAIADGLGSRRGRERFREMEQLLDHRFPLETWTDRLPAVERTLLTLVLGCLAPARYVVVDDLDAQLTDAQERWIQDAMALLQLQGNRFVVSLLEQSPVPADACVLHLAPPEPREPSPTVLHRLRSVDDLRGAQPGPTTPATDTTVETTAKDA